VLNVHISFNVTYLGVSLDKPTFAVQAPLSRMKVELVMF